MKEASCPEAQKPQADQKFQPLNPESYTGHASPAIRMIAGTAHDMKSSGWSNRDWNSNWQGRRT